ncbi:chromate transporter [Leucobacter sp. CSA1]|uniref:Chromate transporter n=1 Tax=Leucobacter chromiisoli TaxID=2796471 RepID=A0A934Q7V1_9MICO|nr:chromate transporter [Leucobacter chromiisoli]MBK0419083.1 chromate transporter [Leucobacter chromiisoli]
MLKIGAIGFGGGSALIPVMERELVGGRMLNEPEFTQDTVIANITPGALPVKLAGLAGVRLHGGASAVAGALCVALPGAVGTVALLALSRLLGPGVVEVFEYSSVGITAFIVYLLLHYILKVLAPSGRLRPVPLAIALAAFALTGLNETLRFAGDLLGATVDPGLPALSVVQVVIVALALITGLTLWQRIRSRRRRVPPPPGETGGGSGIGRRALIAIAAFTALFLLGAALALLVPPVRQSLGFMLSVAASTGTSFGGGEAYVAVADGFFVATGAVDSTQFYGQVVPIANALPGPILVKIAAGVAYLAGGPLGLVMATAALLITVGVCGAAASGVLAGYGSLGHSRLVRNIALYILPVICGLLMTTALSMLRVSAQIAGEAGAMPVATLAASLVLVVVAYLAHRFSRVPDVVVILVFGVVTFAALKAISGL